MKKTSSATVLDKVMEIIFIICTASSIVAVFLIMYFIFTNSIPAISEVGLVNFLTGREWQPGNGKFGIFPMIIGSIYVTLGAALIGIPIGLFTAVFMAYYCPRKIKPYLQGGINLLAGIPSVVYGLWALEAIVPRIRQIEGVGFSILAAMILLGIMILPTVVSLSQSAIEQVPHHFYQGAIGLGARKERAIFSVVVPAASSGVMSAGIMGIGRAIGETMAVNMVIGNQPIIPQSVFQGARTLTTNIVLEMNYAAAGIHRDSLIATGAVLFVFILILNLAFSFFKKQNQESA